MHIHNTPGDASRLTRPAWSGRFAAILVVILVVPLCLAGTATARRKARGSKAPATMASRDIKPGMKGFGLTVMRGTKIERFGVEFIGVLHNKLPQQDMIMIRCSGLNLEHSGIIAGMSGSPIYVTDPAKGDLLVGALSYGFGFNKDPVAGVTPIAAMLPELDRKLRPPPSPQRIGPPSGKRKAIRVNLPGLASGDLRPVAIPLSVAGFHPDLVQDIQASFGDQGFHIAQGAGGGSSEQPSPPFEPGSAISLSLVRGDMSIAGVGTVTWVSGDRFIAFGHPFRGLGQVHLPIGGAHIVWVLASQSLSFKMGYPLAVSGVLDQDRQPAVAGRSGVQPTLVPMDVEVVGKGTGTSRKWHVEITDQPFFFPLAVAMVLGNAVRVSEPIVENAALKAQLIFELGDGRAPLVLRDQFLGLDGNAHMRDATSLGRKVAKVLMFNGFERLGVKRIRARFEADVGRPLAFLESVRTPSLEVDVGQEVTAKVEFLLPNKGVKILDLKLPVIPHDLEGETIKVWIGAENKKIPERAEPANIEDLLRAVRKHIPRNRLAAVITLPDETWMVRGRRLTDLPAGVMGELTGHQRETKKGKQTLRNSIEIPWAINGSRTLTLRVRPKH